MAESSKKSSAASSRTKIDRVELEALADIVLEKQHGYLEARFNQLEQIGQDTEEKLCAIQADLMSLKGNIGTVKVEMGKIRAQGKDNSSLLSNHESEL